ncbi:MAG: hypothetical protein IJO76_03415 [Clostridia bacterium]|nr:hypothetical protein [Clostridia bacterium]
MSSPCHRASRLISRSPRGIPPPSAAAFITSQNKKDPPLEFAPTVGDENTPADNCVTVRERDSMEQVRMPISELKAYLEEKIAF